MNIDSTTQSNVERYLNRVYETSSLYVKEKAMLARLGSTVWQVNRTGAVKTQVEGDTKIDYTFCLDRELLSPYTQCLVVHLVKLHLCWLLKALLTITVSQYSQWIKIFLFKFFIPTFRYSSTIFMGNNQKTKN